MTILFKLRQAHEKSSRRAWGRKHPFRLLGLSARTLEVIPVAVDPT